MTSDNFSFSPTSAREVLKRPNFTTDAKPAAALAATEALRGDVAMLIEANRALDLPLELQPGIFADEANANTSPHTMANLTPGLLPAVREVRAHGHGKVVTLIRTDAALEQATGFKNVTESSPRPSQNHCTQVRIKCKNQLNLRSQQ